MKLEKKSFQMLIWINRILAAAILIFALPFYFGYGNPLPFLEPEYSLWDNTWLTVMPIMFIGLALGWKWPKIGGFFITIPILVAIVIGLISRVGISFHMFIPFIVGVFYIVLGYLKVITVKAI